MGQGTGREGIRGRREREVITPLVLQAWWYIARTTAGESRCNYRVGDVRHRGELRPLGSRNWPRKNRTTTTTTATTAVLQLQLKSPSPLPSIVIITTASLLPLSSSQVFYPFQHFQHFASPTSNTHIIFLSPTLIYISHHRKPHSTYSPPPPLQLQLPSTSLTPTPK